LSFAKDPTGADAIEGQESCRKRRVTMEEKILDAMQKAGKPVRPGDVAEMIGEDGKAVSRIIGELKKKGKVVSPKRCFYSLAD